LCRWTPGIDSTSLSTLTFGATSHLDAALRGYDVVLVLNVANGFYLPLLRLRHIPSVLNTDGLEWMRGKWGKVAKQTFLIGAELSARHADLLIADSAAIGDIWAKRFEVNSRFIPYGATVITEHGSEQIKSLGLTPEGYVLAVARLIPENNVDLLLNALEHHLQREVPTVVVGSGTSKSPIERRLRDLDHRGISFSSSGDTAACTFMVTRSGGQTQLFCRHLAQGHRHWRSIQSSIVRLSKRRSSYLHLAPISWRT